ncbi:MAG TPA: hypothetical protein VFT13_13955 [Candidatus Krumholzibacteria bacterium]|nr:hypothetical protein [Candidatus Krumholzibacteria bacterium]
MTRTFACAVLVLCLFLLFSASALATDWKALAGKGSGEVVTVLEVGGGDEYDEADPPFLKPVDICVASDHSFYVVDYDGFIVHFSPDGEALDRFGNQGEGPGELMYPMHARIDARGRLMVYEIGNRRFSFLQPDGTFIESRPLTEYVDAVAVARDGSIVLVATADEMPKPGFKNLSRLVRYDRDLSHAVAVDSIRTSRMQVLPSGAGSIVQVSSPFATNLVFCLLTDDAIAYARTDRYEIHIVGPDLKERAVLRRGIEPLAVTEKDRERYFASFESNDPDFVRQLRAKRRIPQARALHRRVVLRRPLSDRAA